MKQNILFLCTGNSCRSQMAEGWALSLQSDHFNFYSAGTQKHGLNPQAVEVMKEVGIDISDHYSKTIDDLSNVNFDYIFTVCGHANENCPYFSSGKVIHVGFEDPPTLSKNLENMEDILKIYRRVRDEIKIFIENIKNYL